VSLQRSITKDTVFEVRYQGNRGYAAWVNEGWNATNIQQGADSGGIIVAACHQRFQCTDSGVVFSGLCRLDSPRGIRLPKSGAAEQ
jgi:hypothetical protein